MVLILIGLVGESFSLIFYLCKKKKLEGLKCKLCERGFCFVVFFGFLFSFCFLGIYFPYFGFICGEDVEMGDENSPIWRCGN